MKKSTKKGKSTNDKTSRKDQSVEPVGIVSRNRVVYDSSFHPADFVAHCREGNNVPYICASWGIARSTLDNWVRQHPEFAIHFAIGRTAFEGYWSNFATENAKGKRKNSLGWFIWHSKNNMGWSDEPQHSFGIADDEQPVWETEDGELNSKNKKVG